MPAFFLATFGYSWAVFGLLVLAVGPEQLASSRLWHVPFAWGPPLAAVVAFLFADTSNDIRFPFQPLRLGFARNQPPGNRSVYPSTKPPAQPH